MNEMRTGVLTLTAVAAVAALALAQGNPRGAASATVGGKTVSVDYGRPALKGRELDELLKQLPADRIWRAGENQVSTLTSEGDLLVGGKRVSAGKYSVYVHAGENGAWDLVLNKDLGLPLGKMWPQAPDNLKNEPWPHYTDYSKSIAGSEAARVPMKAAKAAQAADMFTITFTPKGQGQELTLAWGSQAWSLDLEPAK
ncbi:MAG TPA: DUF2911 domain-containing protein [Vicinamibacteria bacterium]|nr:DUF2911 domain-containing protein [Vicinamibacteria bacterium]